jgi:hypothetical protein
MRRTNRPVRASRAGGHVWVGCRSALLPWGVVAALWLAVPWWGWGQSNALPQAVHAAGTPIRLSPLHPDQIEELKGRPLCVYNFTSW